MNKSDLRKIAIRELNKKNVQSIKKLFCEQFTDKKQKKDCITEFDKSFIKSFISACQKKI